MNYRWPVGLSALGGAVLLAIAGAAAQGTTPAPAGTQRAEAEVLREATRARLEAAVAARPGLAVGWAELSGFRAGYGDLPGAIAAVEHGRKAVPESVELMIVHARLLLAARRVDDAVAAYRRALAADPDAVVARVELGDIYRNVLRRAGPALVEYDLALEVDAGLVPAIVGKAGALILQGWVEDAVTLLARARGLSPQSAPLRLMLADAYLRVGKRAEARAEVEAAVAAQPGYVDARIARGNLRRGAGQLDGAHEDFSAALAQNPAAVGALVGRALTYQASGRNNDKAQELFAEALRLDPNNIFALNGLAWMLAESKTRLAEALEMAERAAKLAPDQADILDTLGWVLRQRGDASRSVQVLARAAALRPSAEIFTHLGLAQLDSGQTEAARSAFLAALAITPGYPPATQALGELR